MAFSDMFVTGSDGKRILNDAGCPILKDYPETYSCTVVVDGKTYDVYTMDTSKDWMPDIACFDDESEGGRNVII